MRTKPRHSFHGSPYYARLAYTMRGVLYGSLAWPVFAAVTFVAVTWWVGHPRYRLPD